MPHLTKSKFTSGLTCPRQLWFKVHDPLPFDDPPPGSPMDVGNIVGHGAHSLLPGGVEVTERPWEHAEAVARTAALMADADVPAIFEAAFEFDDIRIRVDVLERLGGGQWGIREVKSSGSLKDYHLWDAAVQLHVAEGAGVNVGSVALVHVDTSYVHAGGEPDWSRLLMAEDITTDCRNMLAEVADEVERQHATLSQTAPPDVHPTRSRCQSGFGCDYWERCTAGMPDDWVQLLPRFGADKIEELADQGIHAMSDLPPGYRLNGTQQRVVKTTLSTEPFVSPDIGNALHNFGPPAYYLDFETMRPMIPVYPDTSPAEEIVFQWSLHHLSADGLVSHREFLGPINEDPRRALAEALIGAIADDGAPILAYNASFEARVLRELADRFDDLAEPLRAIERRLLDLLVPVKSHTYFPGYKGSFSLKTVGPTLAPTYSYDDLEGVAVGTDASAAYWHMVYTGEDDPEIREALLAYCGLDTDILMAVHQKLIELS